MAEKYEVTPDDRDGLIIGCGILAGFGVQLKALIDMFDSEEGDPHHELFAPVYKVLDRCHEDLAPVALDISTKLEIKLDE